MTQWLHPSQCKVILAAVKYAMCTENILLTRILYSRKCLEDVHYIMMYGRIDWTLEQHRSVGKFIMNFALKISCYKNYKLFVSTCVCLCSHSCESGSGVAKVGHTGAHALPT